MYPKPSSEIVCTLKPEFGEVSGNGFWYMMSGQ